MERREMAVSRVFCARDDPGKRVTNDTGYRTKEIKQCIFLQKTTEGEPHPDLSG